MNINLLDVQKSLNLIFKNLDESGISTISLDTDMYWTTDSDERSDMSREPKMIVNSLYDDIDNLNKINSGELEPLSVSLDWVGNILISIGEALRRSDETLM